MPTATARWTCRSRLARCTTTTGSSMPSRRSSRACRTTMPRRGNGGVSLVSRTASRSAVEADGCHRIGHGRAGRHERHANWDPLQVTGGIAPPWSRWSRSATEHSTACHGRRDRRRRCASLRSGCGLRAARPRWPGRPRRGARRRCPPRPAAPRPVPCRSRVQAAIVGSATSRVAPDPQPRRRQRHDRPRRGVARHVGDLDQVAPGRHGRRDGVAGTRPPSRAAATGR